MATKYRFPDISEGVEGAVNYRDRHFAYTNTYRNRHMQRIVQGIYYDLGKQWLEFDSQMIEDGRGFAFREMQQTAETEMPRPVTNHIAPAIDVEFATLAKRQWVPKVPTLSRDPRMQAAAKVANDILNHRLYKLHWDDLRDQFIRNTIAMGTGIMVSRWDESFYETTYVETGEPVSCVQCGYMYSKPEAPAGFLDEYAKEGTDPQLADYEGQENVQFQNCPDCGGELQDVELDEETSVNAKDAFGRPMGEYVPKGNTNIEVLTPFEYYPENSGVFIDRLSGRMHGICKVRSLNWVEEHYPDYADQIEAEDVTSLLQEHPLLGTWDLLGRFDAGYDSGLLDQHVRVYELIQEPTYRFPKGRYICIIGQAQAVVVRNGDLIRTVTDPEQGTLSVPEISIATAVWKSRPGEFWGKGLPDDLISPQNRVNGIDAQVIEARERMGSPNLLVPEDADLQGPESRAGYGGAKLFRYNLSALNPEAKPEVFGSILMPSGVYQEREAMLQDMTRIIGPADIEIGEAPRNVTTTSGLQILGEQAERRRGTREREITTALQKIWEHQLNLLWVLRVDEDTYEAETPDGTWELKQYNRLHIKGQIKVEVEKQAYIDKSIVMREAAREAQMDMLYDISSPLARKRLLELRGLPTDVNEDTTLQIDHAKRIWADFVDQQQIPVVDQSLDNPSVRFQVLGTMLLQDEGKRITDRALWPTILPWIAGWEDELMMADQQDAAARATYGGEPPPQQAAETYARLMETYQQAQQAYDAQTQINGGQQVNPPPQPPPPPIFLPRQFEQRILMVWMKMIQQYGQLEQAIAEAAAKRVVDINQITQDVQNYLKFRAVVEAYRLLGQQTIAPGTTPGQPGVPPPSPNGPAPGAGGPAQPPAPPSPPGGNAMEAGG